jgi:hypothetical protein
MNRRFEIANLRFAPLSFRSLPTRSIIPLITLLLIAVSAQAASPAAELRTIAASSVQEQTPTGEAIVVLDENLLNALLAGLLETDAVAYPLGAGGNSRECRSEVELLREAEGVRTSIRFAGDRINLPLAFRGSYNAGLLGCPRFTGTAEASLNLFFNEARQALLARIEVREINLRNLPALAGGSIRSLVQDAVNRRVNPVTILRLDQLTTRLTLKENAALTLRARRIQPEINGRELRLRIRYEFGN